MNKLTKVEKRFLAAIAADPKAPPIALYNLNDPQALPRLRKKMRTTAYHEAGHFAALLFTDLELPKLAAISIIPKDGIIGYVAYERSWEYAVKGIASYPPPLQRPLGMIKLLEKFAGVGTEMILDKSKKWGSIYDYWTGGNDEYEEDEERSDYSVILGIAEIMANPDLPVQRILKEADKWTLEMLRIPGIWNAVETIAGKLLKQGQITNREGELFAMIDKYYFDVPKFYNFPKWKRRLSPTPRERKNLITWQKNKNDYAQVQTLQNILVASCTGQKAQSSDYTALRIYLLDKPEYKQLLPSFVRTTRELNKFWPYMKSKSSTYAGRRDYIWKEFTPILDYIDGKIKTSDKK